MSPTSIVALVAERYPNIERYRGSDLRAEFSLPGLEPHPVRPCLGVRPVSATVLGKTSDGWPVLLDNRVGQGRVCFFCDPIELDDRESAGRVRRCLYAAFLRAVRVAPFPVTPDAPWLHVMAQPTARGTVHVLVNTQTAPGGEWVQVPTAAGPVRLMTRNRWPAMAAARPAEAHPGNRRRPRDLLGSGLPRRRGTALVRPLDQPRDPPRTEPGVLMPRCPTTATPGRMLELYHRNG